MPTVLRKPRLLLLAASLTLAWVFYFMVYIQGYEVPFRQPGFLSSNPEEHASDTSRGGTSSSNADSHSNTDTDTTVGNTTTNTTETGLPQEKAPRILLVSAIYPVAQAKFPEYEKHLALYLGSITTDMYIYTTPELETSIRALIPPSSSSPSSSTSSSSSSDSTPMQRRITINTTYASPMDIPPLAPHAEAYTIMRKLKDRAKSKHAPELYAYSNSRPFFLERALQHSAYLSSSSSSSSEYDYDYAFWNEASSFHQPGHLYTAWPDPKRIQEVWDEAGRLPELSSSGEDLVFFPVMGTPHPSMRFWEEAMGPVDNKITQGTFFGGTPASINWLARTFYAYHDHYMAQGFFVGKEQALINALAFLYPERFIAVWYGDPEGPASLASSDSDASVSSSSSSSKFSTEYPLGRCASPYFYYHFFLSSPHTQTLMRSFYLNGSPSPSSSSSSSSSLDTLTHLVSSSWYTVWDWVRGRERTECQVTRVVSMGSVLKRAFGEEWGGVRRGMEGVRVPERVSWG